MIPGEYLLEDGDIIANAVTGFSWANSQDTSCRDACSVSRGSGAVARAKSSDRILEPPGELHGGRDSRQVSS